MKQNKFWIEPIAGLGNRMQVLASAYYLAHKHQKQLSVLWNNNEDLGADFGDIFKTIPEVEIVPVTTDGYRKKPLLRWRSERLRKKLSKNCDYVTDVDKWGKRSTQELLEMIEQGVENADTVYIKSWKNFCPVYDTDEVRVDFLQPSENVCKRGQDLFDRINRHTIGVHIRRTDHEMAIAGSPLEAFLCEMKRRVEEDAECNFYVATDDAEVEQYVKAQFGERVFFYEGKNWKRNDRDGILDACVEMWALSMCSMILGSMWSTFSLMAAKIGGKELLIMR